MIKKHFWKVYLCVLRDAASKIEYFPTIGYNMRKTVCQESSMLSPKWCTTCTCKLSTYALNRLVY